MFVISPFRQEDLVIAPGEGLDVAFTSYQKRAIKTLNFALEDRAWGFGCGCFVCDVFFGRFLERKRVGVVNISVGKVSKTARKVIPAGLDLDILRR